MLPSRSTIITGGNAGLGFEAAKVVTQDRSNLVVIACRNRELGEQAVRELEDDGGRAVFLPLDLSVQTSVRQFADLFRLAGLPPLHALICNAGMQNVASPQKTIEGYETTFAVNHLGHYLLVRLLLNDLVEDGRIAIVSSSTHDPKQKTGMPAPAYKDADTLAHDFENSRSAGLRRYTTSKLCNLLFVYQLSRRLNASDDPRLQSLRVNAIDPGLMPATGLARSWPKPLRWVSQNVLPLLRLVSDNVHAPQTSGRRLAELTLGTDAALGGRYFSNGKAIPSSDLSHDQERQRELWESSARMTGLPISDALCGEPTPTNPQ